MTFFQEKEGAIVAMKEICVNAGPAFVPYLQVIVVEGWPWVSYKYRVFFF
jgi:hypothetical protein